MFCRKQQTKINNKLNLTYLFTFETQARSLKEVNITYNKTENKVNHKT
jgi:hypothetical protein